MIKLVALLLCVTLCGGLCACAGTSPAPFSPLVVRAPKIGAADCFILTCDGETMVIDLGEEDDGAEILENLGAEGIHQIQTLVITHFDKDHIGSAQTVLSQMPVTQVLQPGYEKTGKRYQAYLDALAAQGITPQVVTQQQAVTLGDATVTIYPPLAQHDNDNDNSLCILVEHGAVRMLFTGDAMAARTQELIGKQISQGPYQLLKIPHHGRYNDTSEMLLQYTQPQNVWITCSDKNPPDAELSALLSLQTALAVYETRQGDIRLSSDGKEVQITQ